MITITHTGPFGNTTYLKEEVRAVNEHGIPLCPSNLAYNTTLGGRRRTQDGSKPPTTNTAIPSGSPNCWTSNSRHPTTSDRIQRYTYRQDRYPTRRDLPAVVRHRTRGPSTKRQTVCPGMYPDFEDPWWGTVKEWVNQNGGTAEMRNCSYYVSEWYVPEHHFEVTFEDNTWKRSDVAGQHNFDLVDLLRWIQQSGLPEIPQRWQRWLNKQTAS